MLWEDLKLILSNNHPTKCNFQELKKLQKYKFSYVKKKRKRDCSNNKKRKYKPVECSICYEMKKLSKKITHLTSDDVGFAVIPSCKDTEHAVCVQCIRSIILNMANSPFSVNSRTIKCFHKEECDTEKLGWSLDEIISILKPEEQKKIINEYGKLPLPGFFVQVHPVCGKEILIAYNEIQDCDEYDAHIYCKHCKTIFCFVCLMNCEDDEDSVTEECPCQYLNKHGIVMEHAINHYFVRNHVLPISGGNILPRNSELSIKDCAKQIYNIITAEDPAVQCSCCGIKMTRTIMCNELNHCGLHKCNICGRSSTEHESVLFDHFNNKCPRNMGDFKPSFGYKCVLNKCHTHEKPCTKKSHAVGIKNINLMRKTKICMKMFYSLPTHMRSQLDKY